MQKTIHKIVDYAVHVAAPEMILIFGSYARCEENVYSDLDLLIVTRTPFMKKEIGQRISAYANGCAMKADVIVCTPEEMEKASLKPLSFLHTIVQEGKMVYQKSDRHFERLHDAR